MNGTAFESVVNAYYQPLYRFALALAKSESAAGDLTQETFRRFASKGHQVRDAARVKAWLFTTLYRQFLRDRQRERRMQPLELIESAEECAPASESDNAIDGQTARDALLELEDIFRAPLSLFYLEEHSYLEIASLLGVPIGTVMSRIARGRELLRQKLGTKNLKPGSPLLSLSL